MNSFLYTFCFLVLLCFFSFQINAQPTTITDTTPGTATNDGVVNGGEYVGSHFGINSGFGNVIGMNSTIFMDSDVAGNINMGIVSGGGSLFDQCAIYINSQPGGFPSTNPFNDLGDPGRANISAAGFAGPGKADITFAPGFEADYAISVENVFAGIFQLVGGGSHNYIGSANINPGGIPGNGQWELNFNLSDIGLSPGDGFNYVITYGNAFDGGGFFRSDEFHGVAQATVPPGNIGINPVVLSNGDFNTFISYSPPPAPIPTLGEWGIILLILLLLTGGTLALMQQKAILAGQDLKGNTSKVPVHFGFQFPFDRAGYISSLKFAIAFGIGLLMVFLIVFGKITAADWFGVFIGTPLLAYLLFLWRFFDRK